MGVLGQALWDYHRGERLEPLIVECDRAPDEEMQRAQFFYSPSQMPLLDRTALKAAKGAVLDIGAGAGRHSLALQAAGHRCVALEYDADCASLCQERGVLQVENQSWQAYAPGPIYDTALALMNGAGLCGTNAGLPQYAAWLASCLAPGGKVLMDTSTVTYLPRSPEKNRRLDEVWFAFRYGEQRTERFSWLFTSRSEVERQLRRAGLVNVHALFVEAGGRVLISGSKRV